MEVFDAVRTVLAIRQFQDKPIPEAIVHQIVEAAHLTASSINGQPWHFVVVQDKEMLRKLGSLAEHGPYIAQAPLAIVVGMEKSPLRSRRCEPCHSIHDSDRVGRRCWLQLGWLREFPTCQSRAGYSGGDYNPGDPAFWVSCCKRW